MKLLCQLGFILAAMPPDKVCLRVIWNCKRDENGLKMDFALT